MVLKLSMRVKKKTQKSIKCFYISIRKCKMSVLLGRNASVAKSQQQQQCCKLITGNH